jgi:photosystem I subunit 10
MNLLSLSLLANVPQTVEWNIQVGIVMIAANLVAIFIGRFAIKNAGTGPDLPVGKPALWKNFGIAELLATLSFGHILGAGFILAFANAGLL